MVNVFIWNSISCGIFIQHPTNVQILLFLSATFCLQYHWKKYWCCACAAIEIHWALPAGAPIPFVEHNMCLSATSGNVDVDATANILESKAEDLNFPGCVSRTWTACEEKDSAARNWTRVSRVTGGNADQYTTADWIATRTFISRSCIIFDLIFVSNTRCH